MGLTFITTKIINPQKPAKTFSRKFLVDSGIRYSVVDQKILKKIGVKSTKTLQFTLPNGETMNKKVGELIFQMKKDRATSPVIFGNDGIFTLGSVTLETFGFIVDPINRQLRRLPMLI
ncbi:MAG: hypothetical protein U9Q67_00895 [Patescibacteria group bacterium]|nr:hypothetical protein [Patescibacteria group bacterium]